MKVLLLQPMPGKHTLLAQLDRYSKEFIIARMKLLHVFLNRVVNHPILSCDKNLYIFLTTKPAVKISSFLWYVLVRCTFKYCSSNFLRSSLYIGKIVEMSLSR